jgi:hypothetical protein
MNPSRSAGSLACVFVAACGGGGAQTSPDAATNLTSAAAWTISGRITLPAGEAASNIKVMASYDILDKTGVTYVSPVVSLSASGSPGAASFSLALDMSAVPSGERIVFLYAFADDDGDGISDTLERWEALRPLDASCAVWGNGTGYAGNAVFVHWNKGDTAMGTSGGSSWSFEAAVTGWYFSNCSNDSCLQLVSTADTDLTGANVTYLDRLQ